MALEPCRDLVYVPIQTDVLIDEAALAQPAERPALRRVAAGRRAVIGSP